MVVAGIPDTSTTALGAVGMACPPCEHSTVAPMCKIGPGTPPPFLFFPLHAANFKQPHSVGARHTTVSAPVFTSTVGPIRVIIAPLPLSI